MNRDELIKVFVEKNKQINLSAIRQDDQIMVKHIQDSLEANMVFRFVPGSSVCDIGTGSWFPLLPLAINNPKVRFFGMDSTKKKVDAVNDMASQLWLNNVKVLWSRIEEFNGAFDVVIARAVAHVDKLIPWSYRLLKPGWYYVLYKQVSPEEKRELLFLCKQKKMKLIKEHIYSLFDGDIQRVIYVIAKIKN